MCCARTLGSLGKAKWTFRSTPPTSVFTRNPPPLLQEEPPSPVGIQATPNYMTMAHAPPQLAPREVLALPHLQSGPQGLPPTGSGVNGIDPDPASWHSCRRAYWPQAITVDLEMSSEDHQPVSRPCPSCLSKGTARKSQA